MLPVSKTDIAKMAVQQVVALKAQNVAENLVAQYTELDTETITVKVGTLVAGHLVAQQLRPLTDKAVDLTIAKIKSWRGNKNTK
jgi:hypothetical protein